MIFQDSGRGVSTTNAACPHQPPCPGAHAPDHDAAHIRVTHPDQGWTLLCNGIIVFDDTGELLPDGSATAPHRAGTSAVV